MHLIRNVFSPVKKIESGTALKTTKVDKVIGGQSVTVMSLTGNLWINPLGTAVANHTSIKLLAGERINLVVKGTLSMISDATGTDWNVVVWDI